MPKIKYILMLGVAVCALNSWAMERGEGDPDGTAAAPARAIAGQGGADAAVIDRRLLIGLPQELMEQVLACLNLEAQEAYRSVCHQTKNHCDEMHRHRVASSLKPTQLDADVRLFSNLIYETLTDEGLALITHKPNLKPEATASLCRKLEIDGSLILKNNYPLMAAMRQQEGITERSLVETVAEALEQAGQTLSSFDKAVLQHKFAPYTILQKDGAGDFVLEHFNAAAFKSLKETYYEVPAEGDIAPAPLHTNMVVSLETLGLPGRKEALAGHFAAHQDHTLIIDVADDPTELTIQKDQLPENVKNLAITNSGGQVTAIGDEFLSVCDNLTEVNLSALSNVTRIGSFFLAYCSGLTALDLSPLSNVHTIGDAFLYACEGLTALDFSGLSSVHTIGDSFLSGCKGLTALDLNPLSNVHKIGGWFLNGCTGLTALDFSGLSNVYTIGNAFLGRCTGLTALDLSGLSNVRNIEDSFLKGCTGLTGLDLSGLSKLTEIKESFLFECTNLREVDLSGLSTLTRVGNAFIEVCDALQRLIAPKYLEAQLHQFAYLRGKIHYVEEGADGDAAV